MPVAEWKWDHFEMVFVSELPRTSSGWISVWVSVDRLTKAAQFLAVKTRDPLTVQCRLCIEEIVRRHGVSLPFVSDSDPRFVGPFEVV